MTKDLQNMNRAEKMISLLNISNRKEVMENLTETIENYKIGTENAGEMFEFLFDKLGFENIGKQEKTEIKNDFLLAIKEAAGYRLRENYNWNTATKLAPLRESINEGKKSWKGKTEKGRKVEMGQDKNGMYFSEIRDEHGDIESATTKKTKREIDKWFSEHGIKKIKWIKESIVTGSDISGPDSNRFTSINKRYKNTDGLFRNKPEKKPQDKDELDIQKKLEALKKLFNSRNKQKITLTDIKKILQSESIEFRSNVKSKMLAASALINEEPEIENELLEHYFTEGRILESSGGSSSFTSWNSWQGITHQVVISRDGLIKSSNTFLARIGDMMDKEKYDYLTSKGIRIIEN